MVAAAKRVLVVDDEPIVRESYSLALTDAGYSVQAVASGRDAVQACRTEHFDVVLADIRMPDMDGIEVARIVTREFPDVRVVLITGYPSQETAEQASRLGVSDYLQKPIGPDRLSAATAAALTRPRPQVSLSVGIPAAPPAQEEKEVTPMSYAQPAIPALVPDAGDDMSAAAAVLAIITAPLIGFAYYVLFPFVAIAVALGVVAKEVIKALRGE